jgi:biotin operon repressor
VSATATANNLLAVLQKHVGADNGIGVKELAEQLGCAAREVRDLVTELRMIGIAVCGHPSTGYFIARTHEELERTLQFLRNRAMHSLVLESKLRKVPLPDLIGQLKLPT